MLYHDNIPLCYALFKSFLNKYLPNVFHSLATVDGNTLAHVKGYLKLVDMVLRYHDYQLWEELEKKGIGLESSAISWIMTFFGRICDVALLLEIYDIYFIENDCNMIFYLIAAILILNREKIMHGDTIKVLTYLSREFHISGIKELSQIYIQALTLRANTPLGFSTLAERLGLFSYYRMHSSQELKDIETNSVYVAMPIYTHELNLIRSYGRSIPYNAKKVVESTSLQITKGPATSNEVMNSIVNIYQKIDLIKYDCNTFTFSSNYTIIYHRSIPDLPESIKKVHVSKVEEAKNMPIAIYAKKTINIQKRLKTCIDELKRIGALCNSIGILYSK